MVSMSRRVPPKIETRSSIAKHMSSTQQDRSRTPSILIWSTLDSEHSKTIGKAKDGQARFLLENKNVVPTSKRGKNHTNEHNEKQRSEQSKSKTSHGHSSASQTSVFGTLHADCAKNDSQNKKPRNEKTQDASDKANYGCPIGWYTAVVRSAKGRSSATEQKSLRF